MQSVPLPNASYDGEKIRLAHEPDGPYPIIIPHPGVRLTVNGEPKQAAVSVTLEDTVEVKALSEVTKGSWAITIAHNGLSASVRLRPHREIKRSLPELEPESMLKLVPREEEVVSSPLTLDKLMLELRLAGITYGVDLADCATVVQATEEIDMVVAKGNAPVPGTDARLELFFSTEEKELAQIEGEGQVDFKERFTFTSVAPGERLARMIPAVQGVPGTNVRGEPLFPPHVDTIELKAGHGAELVDGEVRASRKGRPILKRHGTVAIVEVSNELPINGNVDMITGNISFPGNVSILGDVTTGMIVTAGGAITIGGVVESATVTASGAVRVAGSIIGSTVQSGAPPIFLMDLKPLREQLEESMDSLRDNITVLSSQIPISKRHLFPQLMANLLRQRFITLGKILGELLFKLDNIPDNILVQLTPYIDVIDRFMGFLQAEECPEAEVRSLLAALQSLWEFVDTYQVPKVDVIAKSCINSTLTSSGAITILGEGCHNSTLRAAGSVKVFGVFRGGELRAGADVVLKALGSDAGVPTLVRAPRTARVTVQQAYDNTAVMLGHLRHNFTARQTGVVLRVKDDMIVTR